MTYACGYNGTAAVQEHRPDPASAPTYGWLTADEQIHIVAELVDNPFASEQISRKYNIGAWCPEADAYHAILREETQ